MIWEWAHLVEYRMYQITRTQNHINCNYLDDRRIGEIIAVISSDIIIQSGHLWSFLLITYWIQLKANGNHGDQSSVCNRLCWHKNDKPWLQIIDPDTGRNKHDQLLCAVPGLASMPHKEVGIDMTRWNASDLLMNSIYEWNPAVKILLKNSAENTEQTWSWTPLWKRFFFKYIHIYRKPQPPNSWPWDLVHMIPVLGLPIPIKQHDGEHVRNVNVV